MKPAAESFSNWIGQLPKWRGWLQLSPERAYMHVEEDYDAHYGVASPEPGEGQGLCALLQSHQVDTSGPAMEIGCGTGFLTHGLALHYPGPDLLITDPSPDFLRLTQNQFTGREACIAGRHYAVFNADDMGLLPEGMFSVIALRSTLHHILRVDEFIAACARRLRPGGALIMGSEPCEGGYLLMGTVAQGIPTALRAAGVEMKPAWTLQLQDFTDTVKFLCLRDLNKTAAEDKHLFDPHELGDLAATHGLQLKFFPTASFRDFAPPYLQSFHCFSVFFLTYLQFSMRFEPQFMEMIRLHLKEQLNYIDECHRSHPGPAITGIFLLKKTAPCASA